jgi:DNA polymerase III alpha subunit
LLEKAEEKEVEIENGATELGATPISSQLASPLAAMTGEERLVADFRGAGMTVGLHPMGHHRAEMKRRNVRSAIELLNLPNGMRVRIAGGVITRQRPGTAKGFVFISLEDETGISNAIVTPQLFEKNHEGGNHRTAADHQSRNNVSRLSLASEPARGRSQTGIRTNLLVHPRFIRAEDRFNGIQQLFHGR